VPQEAEAQALKIIREAGYTAENIGEVIAGDHSVQVL
jgi:hydrogenase maturation factor